VLTPPHPFLPRCSEPGDYFTGMLGGRGFVVVLDEARQVRAYHNICSHRAAAVAVGEGRVPVCEAGAGGLRFECPCVPFATHTSRRFSCAAAMLPASCLLPAAACADAESSTATHANRDDSYHGWQFDMKGTFRGCKVSNGLAGIRNFAPDTSSLTPIRAPSPAHTHTARTPALLHWWRRTARTCCTRARSPRAAL
jgi:hypothetical protein